MKYFVRKKLLVTNFSSRSLIVLKIGIGSINISTNQTYDSRQLGAPRFGKKKPPLKQWRFESKKSFHNVKIKIKRVSGYAIMSDHNEGGFGRNPCPEHLLVTGESHILEISV